MNILYLSHLSGAEHAGPTYSVPKQIEAQSKVDNVFWYNAVKSSNRGWFNLPYYHDLNEYPNESIYNLPEPFCNPDLIVFEQFYNMTRSKLRTEAIKSNIPYIIIPRGELTKKAQARKRLKKCIANYFLCNKFAYKAEAIQYLTKQEFEDSGIKWNDNHIIVPNGIEIPNKVKTSFSKDGIKCIFVGRIEPYQKGLDLLIDACKPIKGMLKEKNCHIHICGPDRENKLKKLISQVHLNGLDDYFSFSDGVYGEEKKQLILDSDVFLIPSRFEGHPMALIEALSLGLPCVATTGSNMREQIEKSNSGWTANNNADSITNALIKMINSSDNYYEISKNAIELAMTFEWKKIALNNHLLFQSVLDGRNNK